MRKRNYGYILLTLLVVSGFAGTVSDTLTKKERKFAVTHLKETKSELLKAVSGLSEEQLNFKPAPDRWSVHECFKHITLAEKGIWEMAKAGLLQPENPSKRSEIKFTDESVLTIIADRSKRFKAPEPIWPDKSATKNIDETIAAFKEQRNALLHYTKNTTEDLRSHIIQSPVGALDVYQMILFIAAHSKRHTLQILEVKADPGFPGK